MAVKVQRWKLKKKKRKVNEDGLEKLDRQLSDKERVVEQGRGG